MTTKYECPICEAFAANFHPAPPLSACRHIDDCPECTCYRDVNIDPDARGVVDFGVNPSREVLAAAGFNDNSTEYRAALDAFASNVDRRRWSPTRTDECPIEDHLHGGYCESDAQLRARLAGGAGADDEGAN